MNEKLIRDLFFAVAVAAMGAGREMRLEEARTDTEGNVLGGAFSKSNSTCVTLSLHVYAPDESAEDDVEDDAEAES